MQQFSSNKSNINYAASYSAVIQTKSPINLMLLIIANYWSNMQTNCKTENKHKGKAQWKWVLLFGLGGCSAVPVFRVYSGSGRGGERLGKFRRKSRSFHIGVSGLQPGLFPRRLLATRQNQSRDGVFVTG